MALHLWCRLGYTVDQGWYLAKTKIWVWENYYVTVQGHSEDKRLLLSLFAIIFCDYINSLRRYDIPSLKTTYETSGYIQQHLTLLSLTVYIFNMRGPSKEQAGKRAVEAFLKLKLTRTLFFYVNFFNILEWAVRIQNACLWYRKYVLIFLKC